ncbi:hypothetical protein, partial [Morganella morganii]|uniref:hypothetical protein n=1 Tax=Morganella morganii TaxID=582 RepID=UPI001C7132EC
MAGAALHRAHSHCVKGSLPCNPTGLKQTSADFASASARAAATSGSGQSRTKSGTAPGYQSARVISRERV